MNKFKGFLVLSSTALVTSPAFAGLAQADKFFNQIYGWLQGAALIVATIMITVSGYKCYVGQSTVRDQIPWIIGSLLIACAPALAKLVAGQ
jgi:type IV secretory pathway VirB2 component (pilin)